MFVFELPTELSSSGERLPYNTNTLHTGYKTNFRIKCTVYSVVKVQFTVQ